MPKTENLYRVKFIDKSGYINQAYELVVQPKFYDARLFTSANKAPVKVNGKWGFINLKGEVSIPPQYDMVGESLRINEIPETKEDDLYRVPSSSFSSGLVGVKLNGKWGFIDETGQLVIPYQFDKVQQFSDGIANASINNLWGAINRQGNWIVSPVNKYPHPINFFQGIAKINIDTLDKIGQRTNSLNLYYFDKSGQLISVNYPPSVAREFQEGLAIIEQNLWQKPDFPPVVATSEYGFISSNGLKCGFQDEQGKVVIKPQFDGCQSFSHSLAAVRVQDKWGYIDKTGFFVVSPQFDYADSLVEERGLIIKDGKIGFINEAGKVVIKPQYFPSAESGYIGESKDLLNSFKEYAHQLEPSSKNIVRHRFSHGLATVATDGKCGYIDKQGKLAIKPQFSACSPFDSYGIAQVRQNTNTSAGSWLQPLYINSKGETFPQYITHKLISKMYPTQVKLLIAFMACLLWVIAISCHEFGHAIVAYWGGDTSVKDKGYLSFNPSRYFHPLHSFILPVIFFFIAGGIPLPGAAVYIEFEKIRNRFWITATAAAGPIASILFGLLLVPVYHLSLKYNFPYWLTAFLAFFISLQFLMAFLNLMPIPPLDGYKMLEKWLPYRLQDRNGIASLIGLIVVFIIPLFIPIIVFPILVLTGILAAISGISPDPAWVGWNLFDRWYAVLVILISCFVYFILKPALVFQLLGLIFEDYRPHIALQNYNRALRLEPNNTWSWECKASTLRKLGIYEEAIPAYNRAIELGSYNRYTRRCLIDLLGRYEWYEEKIEAQIKAVDEYIQSNPSDAWGWERKIYILQKQGCYEEALLISEQAIQQTRGKDGTIWRNKGFILRELERYEEALNCYNKAIEMNSNQVWQWCDKIMILRLLGREDEVWDTCQKAVKFKKKESVKSIWLEAAWILKISGYYGQALKAYNKVIEIAPNNTQAWQGKIDILEQLELYEEAQQARAKYDTLSVRL
ncbi:hypothetical protein DSM106972_079410 [Dulcicalothrix desertica PCC 7102]|uniref:Uncharacterized protein n=1 Tax=Dulcicalothrix desertica PCC 7102 TaxID=232991 RepID=A0A3S1AEY3_9CYAN|nr:hypothetical protein DSM106972_079410 [Dulcicalothrix desertica PCC 7102]